MDSTLETQMESQRFPVLLDPKRRWLLDRMAEMESRSSGATIRFWIDREAGRLGLMAPKEITLSKNKKSAA